MKLQEIIKAKRLEQNLTQEQVAHCLGVSAPAVNKWEKGVSYPDISLLSPLARLLGTDLNTLLSFQENLTEKEIQAFTAELTEQVMKGDYEAGFRRAMEKIAQYPACTPLLFYTAVTLEGALICLPDEERQPYKNELEQLYARAAQGTDPQISYQAKLMLAGRCMERKEYEQAEALLSQLPDMSMDADYMRAGLYVEQQEFSRAAEILELKIAGSAQELETAILMMVKIAAAEEDKGLLSRLTALSEKTAEFYDLWDIFPRLTEFQTAAILKDIPRCMDALKNLLLAMRRPWGISQSPLYKHIKNNEKGYAYSEQMISGFVAGLRTDPDLEFLRKEPEFQGIIKAFQL
ncbi:helix-turn-helix domain-containing protein [Anaerovorax odorimutans]|uniref:Helix-turn-helix domain-containing protein n=1 Tax=Anaerovorax odorimutans TaxID=109327 RepID=A0ABT1RRB9_9FIRM|nr:helix-turn-helix transcriptional regulator [Anaerovorax odorimutans]MCQ4637746.1 helix-turn-helix domain-containing protein [Anaerovorax odorimutans]